MQYPDLIALLNSALLETYGRIIHTSDPLALKTKLYQARTKAQKSGIDQYNDLSIRTSPLDPENELWLVVKPSKEL